MLTELNRVCLKDGREALIQCLEPPDDLALTAGLQAFYQHKSDASRRSIVSRLAGQYAGDCRDRYFVAVIEGRIAGALWYGYGCKNDPVANFGHVYTAPAFRGLGITPVLLRHFKVDIAVSPVMAAFCTCSTEWIARMYREVGFAGIVPGAGSGRLMLANSCPGGDFSSFASAYFRRSGALAVFPGSMCHRHEVDCLAAFTGQFSGFGEMVWAMADYQQALFSQEDGHGRVLVWLDRREHVFGWSATAALAPDLRCFDYSVHTSVTLLEERRLLEESLAGIEATPPLLAWVGRDQERKAALLQACGFRECGRLPGRLLLLRGAG